jgi:hypothetical protein
MTMIHKRDKPTYYRIVGSVSKTVFATAPASKVLPLLKKLQKQHNGEKLEMELLETKVERQH